MRNLVTGNNPWDTIRAVNKVLSAVLFMNLIVDGSGGV